MPSVKANYDYTHVVGAQFTHTPVTDIIERIKKAAASNQDLFRVECTSQMAMDLMTINSLNRGVDLKKVDFFKRQMELGKWRYTDQSSIGININMQLTNGQHRLLACAKSGVTIIINIITRLSLDAIAFTDIGKNRTPGDLFSILAIKEPNKAAAVASLIIAVKNFQRITANVEKYSITNETLVDWTNDSNNTRRLDESMEYTKTFLFKEGKNLLKAAIWSMLYFLLTSKKKASGHEFLTRLASGQSLSTKENSTIYGLHRRLSVFDQEHYFGQRKSDTAKIAYVITAWNMYAEDIDLGAQKLKIDLDTPELPKIKFA
jgi:hypothetical protein